MTKTDYIRQVDAMALPDGLYAKLSSLPSRKETRHAVPYKRWAAIAAALVLVVGLGVATPTILHALTPPGGDIITPPPIVTEGPAIPDEELAELLAAQFPEPTENDTYSLLYSASQRGRTMGALLYRGGGHYVLGTIIVGVFDNETKAPVGEIQIHTGDLGEAVGVVSREQVVYLLWTNCTGRGVDWVAGLYTFSLGELTAVTELPPYTVEGTLPDGALTMLDPEKNTEFWTDHKAAINGAGLDIYSRNPEYHYIRNNEVEEWLLACSIQFQFSTGPTPAPILSDDDLTELLAAQIPDSQGDEEFTLLTSLPQSGHTLGILQYSMTAHAGGFGNLLFGVFDNYTKELTDSAIINGDNGTIYDWYGNAEHTIVRILWANYTEYQGWQDCSAGLYTFSDGKLTITKALLPYRLDMGSTLPEGAMDMFDPEKNADFWTDRRAKMNGGGITIYRRNPEYTTESQGEAIPQWIKEFGLLFNFGEKAYLTGISDEELTELLVAQFPLEKTTEDTWKLIGSSGTMGGRTMGVLQYEREGGGGTPADGWTWSNLLLGVFDNATRELTGPVVRISDMFTYALPYTTGSGGQDYYVLCIGQNYGQGIAENFNVGLYYFDGMELQRVTTSPNAVFPEGMEDMFDPAKREDFWITNYKIVPAPSGFELFEHNPDWYTPNREGKSPWRYMGYVPLAYKYPAPAALESARRFYEAYYTGSSHYSFQLFELVPNYEDIDYPNAQAYHVVLDVGQDAVMDRYFLFDEEGTLLGTRSTPEGSLTIGGVSYALGIHTRNIFGTPVKTNLVPSTGNKSHYSEWFSPNANACGYTYYPATGEYRLSGISTIREDAYTARGIHVGSTVAEVIAAYPEADKEFSAQANYLSYYGPGFTIEFYFSTSLSREEMLKQTVTSIHLSAEYW